MLASAAHRRFSHDNVISFFGCGDCGDPIEGHCSLGDAGGMANVTGMVTSSVAFSVTGDVAFATSSRGG